MAKVCRKKEKDSSIPEEAHIVEEEEYVSITSLETFKTIQNGESPLQLEEPSVKLQTYTGESIRTCGSTNVQVTHNGQTLSLPLIVTEGKGPTLLRRNCLEVLRLDWRAIVSVGSSHTLQSVLEERADAFKDELGKLQGVEAKIYVQLPLLRICRRLLVGPAQTSASWLVRG